MVSRDRPDPTAPEPRRIGLFLGLAAAVVGTVVARAQLGPEDAWGDSSALGMPTPTQPPTIYVMGVPRVEHVQGRSTEPDGSAGDGAMTANGSPGAAAPTGPGASSGDGMSTPATTRTITGRTFTNRYGPVQVALVMTGSHIDDVRVLQVPDRTQRDRDINDEALPRLHDQVILAQGANIEGVSGATYTSVGYAQSVQSALDRA